MKTSTTTLFVLLIAFVFASCGTFKDVSIEKRHYRKGYYVQVSKDREAEKTVAHENKIEAEKAIAAKVELENTSAVVENISQQAASGPASNAFAKENRKNFSTPVAFKKGTAVFREKAIAAPKPVEPSPKHEDDGDHAVALFLLIILAILLPPLAVLLVDGVGVHFLLDLIFWLLGYGFILFIPGGGFIYLGIFGLIAIIYALFVVFEVF